MSQLPRPAQAGALTALALLGTLALAGCSQAVPMTAAVDAVNPDCAEIMVRIPTAIDELDKRETDAQATAAWGSPAAILLHCGVEVPGPSTLPCFTLKNVDWLRDDSDAPTYVFTTYGRDPAVRVTVDSDLASGTNALVALGNAVGSLPAQGACTAAEDVLGTEPAAE